MTTAALPAPHRVQGGMVPPPMIEVRALTKRFAVRRAGASCCAAPARTPSASRCMR